MLHRENFNIFNDVEKYSYSMEYNGKEEEKYQSLCHIVQMQTIAKIENWYYHS